MHNAARVYNTKKFQYFVFKLKILYNIMFERLLLLQIMRYLPIIINILFIAFWSANILKSIQLNIKEGFAEI